MNKKIIIVTIITILVVVTVSGCIGSNELVLNNVTGVDNVKLDSENFTSAIITPGSDYFHVKNGDTVLFYAVTGNTIIFNNLTSTYDKKTFKKDWLYSDEYTSVEKKTIAGIKGYVLHDVHVGDTFFFVINNKIYMIGIDKGLLIGDNVKGVEVLLTAWLKASGFKQTWNYPEETNHSNTKNENTKTDENGIKGIYKNDGPYNDNGNELVGGHPEGL